MNMETPSAEIIAAQVAEMNRLFREHDLAVRVNSAAARKFNDEAQRIKTDLRTAGVKLVNDSRGFFSVKQEPPL